MEEQKLRMKPALLLQGRNNTNVQRIGLVHRIYIYIKKE